MNKILLIKGIIILLTTLIFACLFGIAYGLINYKKLPKLTEKLKGHTPAVVEDLILTQPKGTFLKTTTPCGEFLCMTVSTNQGDKVVVIDVNQKKALYEIKIDTPTASSP